MTSERLPVPGTDETTRQDNEFAGVTARFVPEGQPLAAQTPKFLRIVLDVSKILIYFEVPAELVEDALTLQMYLRRVLPMAHAFVEDAAFLDGTGTGEPEGILRSPGRITVSRAGSNEIVWDDIVTMSSRFLPASWPTAIWVANPDSLPQLGHLVQEVKDGSTNVGGSHVPLDRDGQNLGILGRPLRLTEKMPALGSAGDLLLCDPAQYLIGDRQLYTVEASDQHKFRQQMVAYRLKSRVDGRAWVRSAITPKRGSSTLSPYVALGG
jgi:HK97 family phage major capsid protein